MYNNVRRFRYLMHSSHAHFIYLSLRDSSVVPFLGSILRSSNLKRGCGCQRMQFSSIPVESIESSPKKKKSSKSKSPFTNNVNGPVEKLSENKAEVEFLNCSEVSFNLKEFPPLSLKESSEFLNEGEDSITESRAFDAESSAFDEVLEDENVHGDVIYGTFSEDVLEALSEELEDNYDINDLTSLENRENPSPAVKKKKSRLKKKDVDKLNRKNETDQNKAEKPLNAIDKFYFAARKEGKIYTFNKTLVTYLSVCTSAGLQDVAFKTFMHFSKKKNGKNWKQVNVSVYNQILKDLAREKNYKKVDKVMKRIKQTEVKPDSQTFGYILACLGHEDNSEHIREIISNTLQWMEMEGICLKDVLKSTLFSGKQVEYFVEAVKRVCPNIKTTLTELNPTIESFIADNHFNNVLTNSLNDSLLSNKIESPAKGVVDKEQLLGFVSEQIKQEIEGFVEIPSIVNVEETAEIKRNRDLFALWEKSWREALFVVVAAQKKYMEKNFYQNYFDNMNLYPYFKLLTDEELVQLLIMEIYNICNGSESYSPSQNYLANSLGLEVYNRFLIKYKKETGLLANIRSVYEEYCSWYLNMSQPDCSYVPRVQWKKIAMEKGFEFSIADHPPEWPPTVTLAIGRMLYNTLLTCVMVWNPKGDRNDTFPAFYKVHRTTKLRTRNEIKPLPVLMKVYKGAASKKLIFNPNTLPMVSPPMPWTTINSGGYIICKTDFVRLVMHAYQQKQRMIEGGNQRLFPIKDSLNQLGCIPWKINTTLLDILIKVFNNNGWAEMDIAPPSSVCVPPPPISKSMPPEEKVKLRQLRVSYEKKKKEMHSLWSAMHYKLSLGNSYRDKIFWLPQNMDFRGRTYPVPPHLTHLSADVFRSIMLFAQGKKLGSEGLYWLKLHIINLTGLKKRQSIQDRIDYCEEVMDEIFDSADDPFNGRQWWTKSDEPWQTLAACKELAAAIRSEAPEEYISHLPIHQDGSCNGLQHYAALGRDEAGAHSVNLSPSNLPGDVYSDVAVLVEKARKEDAEEGREIAKALEGCIQRKVIKQTVMTTVYGVTRYGATLQILKQLNASDFDEKLCFVAAAYLSRKTFQSLGHMFSTAKEIQDWFRKCAEGISKNCATKVEWVTPLGLPVVQSYSQLIKRDTKPGKISHDFMSDIYLKPNVIKQKNAFPPNFVHSLDSSHMMLTSLFCQHAGITFVSIHDCFWTHAATVPIMNQICRSQFVALHSQPIMQDLSKFLIEKMSNHQNYYMPYTVLKGKDSDSVTVSSLADVLTNLPKSGDFDIKKVMDSVFFFS